MTTFLDKQYEALRSDWQIIVGPLQPKPVKTATGDAASEREQLRAAAIKDLKYYVRAMGACFTREEGSDLYHIGDALSELESIEAVLESGDLEGASHE